MKVPKIECGMCNGVGRIEASCRQEDGSYKDAMISCPSGGEPEDLQKSWESLCFMVGQLMRCKNDGPWDPNEPLSHGCAACEVERNEVLDHAWHFAKTFHKENRFDKYGND